MPEEGHNSTPTLEMRGISKTFPGVKALDDVQLRAWGGEVLALMGENGAGKSTLMKVLSGAYRADPGGEILIDGKPIEVTDPLSAKAQGISIIYQELSLAPNLTVAENIYLGIELSRRGFVDRAGMRRGAQAVLDRLGAGFTATTLVGRLSIAERQQVEIARALHARSRILVMDEPTTALSSRETDRLFDLIRQLRADGLAIIYISHRMDEVYALSDRVSVLRDGTYVGTLEKGDISADRLVKMMVGRDLDTFFKKQQGTGPAPAETVLAIEDLRDVKGMVKGCSFELRKGEVLGLAGLVGSGRTELARLIYGADARAHGRIVLNGHPVDIAKPIQALTAGVAYLTEDRKAQGLFLDMTVNDNINIGVLQQDALRGVFLNRAAARRRTADAIKALSIRVAGPSVTVGSLSGGNQQKALLSRWLETKPQVLILDEPTRGVDIGAKSEIYRIIDSLAASGVAILLISSELPEVIGTCDRVIVMREGIITGTVGGDTGRAITEETIMAYAAGLVDDQAA